MAKIDKIAIIAYGDGRELRNFNVFAKSLKKELSKKYTKVLVQYVNRDIKFFNRKVYGANSGASIEVYHNKIWKSSQQYKNQVGHWPSGILPHRLVPDKGAYNEYFP